MSDSHLQRNVTVRNSQGLHMRPADLLVKTAGRYACRIELEKDGQAVDCKSILGVLTLGAQHGSMLILRATGDDAAEAIEKLAELFDKGFLETESDAAIQPSN
jgi:phosphocarrier protein